jgi:HEPN domain-containing protein
MIFYKVSYDEDTKENTKIDLWEEYFRAYSKGFNELWKHKYNVNADLDIDLYPVCFLARHAVELGLKLLCHKLIADDIKKRHGFEELLCKIEIKKRNYPYTLSESFFSEAKEFVKCSKEFDEYSIIFRYPTDTKDDFHFQDTITKVRGKNSIEKKFKFPKSDNILNEYDKFIKQITVYIEKIARIYSAELNLKRYNPDKLEIVNIEKHKLNEHKFSVLCNYSRHIIDEMYIEKIEDRNKYKLVYLTKQKLCDIEKSKDLSKLDIKELSELELLGNAFYLNYDTWPHGYNNVKFSNLYLDLKNRISINEKKKDDTTYMDCLKSEIIEYKRLNEIMTFVD